MGKEEGIILEIGRVFFNFNYTGGGSSGGMEENVRAVVKSEKKGAMKYLGGVSRAGSRSALLGQTDPPTGTAQCE